MKIGILLTCYNCDEYVDSCLEPWLKLRDEMNFVIAASSSMFREYRTLGIEEHNEVTLDKLTRKKLDFLVTANGNNLLNEESNRNFCLDFLKKQNCDLIIVIDGDEIFTEDQIRRILEFVNSNPEHDGYAINFRNYTLKRNLFTYEFCHDRIFWMNRHGGIDRFHFDNQFFYADGTVLENKCKIPRAVAYVDHYSWLSSDPRSKDKVKYQNFRYCGPSGDFPMNLRCAFLWNDETNELNFNRDYWEWDASTDVRSGRQLPQVPVLHEMIEQAPFSFDLRLEFSRKENRINISEISRDFSCRFKIMNGSNGDLICFHDMHLAAGYNYWINPNPNINFNEDANYSSILVEIYDNGNMIHSEKLHLIP